MFLGIHVGEQNKDPCPAGTYILTRREKIDISNK